jgi:3-dehydroquinate synthetase
MSKSLNFTFKKQILTPVNVHVEKGALQSLRKLPEITKADKIFVVCDENVSKLYASTVTAALRDFNVTTLIHPADESSKNLETLATLSNAFFKEGGTAKSCICAVGGGITGNIAGFLSSIAFRGISLIHVPTTLLAQLDSAADVKQSVNSPEQKNAIGGYYAPAHVIIDPDVLLTLSTREMRSGFGEAVKHGFAQDLDHVRDIVKVDLQDTNGLERIIRRTIELKIDHWNNTPTIWNDPHKVERLTHLGHTTGKILEMVHVDHLTHGEAIAHGMVVEAMASNRLGYLRMEEVNYIRDTLKKIGLLMPLSERYSVESIIGKLYQGGAEPLFALLKEVGNPETLSTTIPKDILEASVRQYMNYLRSKDHSKKEESIL